MSSCKTFAGGPATTNWPRTSSAISSASAAARFKSLDMMLDRFAFTFRPAFFQVEAQAMGFSPTGGFGAGPADPEAAVAKAREVAPVLTQFESVVGPSGYWLGEFSLADVAAAPFLYRTLVTGMDMSPYPNLTRMRDTVIARPAFAAVEPVPRGRPRIRLLP